MNAASELFNKNGLTATGVDTIIERSGVAKMTFYNTYGSKEELIAEYFTGQDEAAPPGSIGVDAQLQERQERGGLLDLVALRGHGDDKPDMVCE